MQEADILFSLKVLKEKKKSAPKLDIHLMMKDDECVQTTSRSVLQQTNGTKGGKKWQWTVPGAEIAST